MALLFFRNVLLHLSLKLDLNKFFNYLVLKFLVVVLELVKETHQFLHLLIGGFELNVRDQCVYEYELRSLVDQLIGNSTWCTTPDNLNLNVCFAQDIVETFDIFFTRLVIHNSFELCRLLKVENLNLREV
jgi:hypothetical protein